jgi:hypothetical protein
MGPFSSSHVSLLSSHAIVSSVPNSNLIRPLRCRVGAVARNPLGAGALSGSYDGVLRVWNGEDPSWGDPQGSECLLCPL